MLSTVKKIILMDKEQASSLLGRFFTEQGIEIHHQYVVSEEYLFAVDNVCPEILNLPRLKTIEKLLPELEANVRCRLNQDMMMSTLGKKLFETYFNETKDFNIVERFSAEMKKVINFKIHEALNIGYFIDSVIIEAYKAKFDIAKLRNYLNKTLMYAVERNENNEDELPLSISYSHDSDAFAVQVVINAENFDEKLEMGYFTEELSQFCNFLDVAFIPKRSHLIISAVTFKRENLRNANAYIFSQIGSREPGSLPENVELISGLKFNPIVEYKALPKETQTDKFVLASKMADFIINYRQTEHEPKGTIDLSIEDIEHYLNYYPFKNGTRSVDLQLKEFILDLVKNENLLEKISQLTKKLETSSDQIVKGESLVSIDEKQIVKGSKVEKESVSVVKGGVEIEDEITVLKGTPAEKESSILVKGSSTVEEESVTLVKGGVEEKKKDEKFVISGDRNPKENSSEMRVQSLGKAKDDADQVTIIKSNSTASELGQAQSVKSAEVSQAAYDHLREKLEIQVSKMKVIMDSMKNEIVKLRAENSLKDEAILKSQQMSHSQESQIVDNKNDEKKFNLESKENVMLKNSLVKAIEVIKLKDKQIEKSKIDFDMANLAKDLKTKSMEDKIELLKIDLSRAREAGPVDKLKDLEIENKNLSARLELAKGKVTTMNENLESREHAELERREREIESLKTGLSVAQATIDKLRSEKVDLELRMSVDRDMLSKMREEKDTPGGSNKHKSEMSERDNLIHTLTLEKRTAEDKHKQVSMELKKTEQRLKFAISQLEASSKKRDGTGVAAQKSADAYAKQLEAANSRLSDAANEITEKKKEILKLKQENSLISLKLVDLEKKIAQLEKKAA